MAMLCSVTVSIGDETNGVLRLIRLVMGESRVTSLAGNPDTFRERIQHVEQAVSTDIAWKNEKIVVSQATICL